MNTLQFSLEIFAINVRNYRNSLKLSQEKFSKEFESLAGRSGRANISQYETLDVMPPFEFIFEIRIKTGATLDELFSTELEFEGGKIKSVNMLREPIETQTSIAPDEMVRLRKQVENLIESLANMSKLVNDVPALRSEVERLKFELQELRKPKKQ